MKHIYAFLMMLAALMTAVSCQVESIEQEVPGQEGAVTVTVHFASADTKTTLATDGSTPQWAAGDAIWISDGVDVTTHVLTSSEISGSSATFPVHLSGKTLYAVYPASVANAGGFTSYGKISFNIPVVQTGTFAESNICAAKGDIDDGGITLNFKNVTAVMRYEGRTGQIRKIRLPEVTGSAGIFTVDWNPDGSPSVNCEMPGGSGLNGPVTIDLAADARGPYFVAVAAVTFPSGSTFSFVEADGTTVAGSKTLEADRAIVINKIYNMGYALDAGSQGPFTVDVPNNRKVAFAMGDLQYQASTGTWRLAEQQYNMVGGQNGDTGGGSQIVGNVFKDNVYVDENRCKNNLIASDYTGWIDLFGWATSGFDNTTADNTALYFHPYDYTVEESAVSEKNRYGYGPSLDLLGVGESFGKNATMAQYDWGQHNVIQNRRRADGADPAGTWRTPTVEEWLCMAGAADYITGHPYAGVEIRPNADQLRMDVKIKDNRGVYIMGVIFMPDGWTGTLAQTYTTAEWYALEKEGAIFLPANRGRTKRVWGTHEDERNDCVYWTATARDWEKACTFRWFCPDEEHPNGIYRIGQYNRFHGRSVRLVQDIY